jgi:DNA replication factor GINS
MTEDSLITYEALYDILRKEKLNAELQSLEKDFFEKVSRYFNEKAAILASQRLKDSVFAPDSIKKTQKQLENIQKILKEIYERRESKIVQLAISCSRTGTRSVERSLFLKEESSLFDELLSKLNEYRSGIIHNLMRGSNVEVKSQPESIKTKDQPSSEYIKVKFNKEVPKFVGTDLKEYGPFRQNDEVQVPKKVADLLMSTKRADII